MNKVKYILCLLLLISTTAFSYTPSDSAEISILTVSSGKEIYKVYGHSAIRFKDKEKRRDYVYNYGLFSFNTPHFILRYLQGQNYYLLGRESFQHFIGDYIAGGERVYEQTLNLTADEVKTLYRALEENARPENREYLYNVFYDNCATRVYRIIEDNLNDGIIWDNDCSEASFRELLHEYNYLMPFSQMGIDIVFGTKADKNTTCMEQMFLPEKLMDGLEKAKIHNEKPLIKKTDKLLEGRKIHNHLEIILFNIILALILALAIWVRFKKTKFIRGFRIIIYSLFGLCSIVVCFIAFCSIHPTVLPNLNLIWINPLWLFFACLIIIKKNYHPLFQKVLNVWAIILSVYLLLGLAGVFYLHYGLIYIISTLVLISYRKFPNGSPRKVVPSN